MTLSFSKETIGFFLYAPLGRGPGDFCANVERCGTYLNYHKGGSVYPEREENHFCVEKGSRSVHYSLLLCIISCIEKMIFEDYSRDVFEHSRHALKELAGHI